MLNSTQDSPARVETELTRLARVLEAVRRHRQYPMEPAHYLHIRILQAEGPHTPKGLAARLLLDASTVTRQITAMEKAGLIRREPSLHDSRSFLIVPTTQGLKMMEDMQKSRRERVAMLLTDWSEQDRDTLANMLERLSYDLIAQMTVSVADDEPTA